ncbi:putative O-methyltransferase [Aspergillus homomorphus CBS 101889]|uniref:Putative O-methyltransferase n=1 Tax=Aspergillus homomorphus (strain CBS 101889) TaxID=1450537 RepID=A0A395HWC6_ASPHC|nr:putative O-methyltransferase [Aspergillus homomorphus CBS 101889]RAL11829.1 putative O-methyltransferase [Aspergillus homomorphus CBS 101889]
MASTNSPIANEEPLTLISKLQPLTTKLSNPDDVDARKEALQLSKALTVQLEQPENIAVDMAFAPMIATSARIAVDLNLFAHIAQAKEPITAAKLAALSGAEELLIVRVLRLLSAVHFIHETAPQTWTATRITHAMATDEIAAGHRMVSRLIVPAMQSAPAYFQKRGYTCPFDPTDGLMQYAFRSKQTTFERIAADAALLRDFNTFMGNTMGARKYWVDWYPVQERILDGFVEEGSKGKALLVDVGAGKGHDLLAFREKFPQVGGRLVLEDLPAVVDGLRGLEGGVNAGIEMVPYDFFTEQPVVGARVYFYHHILHDWSDPYCLKILKHVSAAMTPGFSKLLVHEIIVHDQKAAQFQAQFDMTMMAFNSGIERTRQQWETLLEAAGLTVVGVWDPVDEGGDGLVEAMKL